jgi:hypothetical protein
MSTNLHFTLTNIVKGPSWSYGSWIYNYLCNQCLSPLTGFESRSGEVAWYNIMW